MLVCYEVDLEIILKTDYTSVLCLMHYVIEDYILCNVLLNFTFSKVISLLP